MDSTPRLTCARCTRRKIKCDKAVPCSACKAGSFHCEAVQRARKPRGRSGTVQKGRDTMLEARVARIEHLLQKAQGTPSEASLRLQNGNGVGLASNGARPRQSPARLKSADLIAPEFWVALSEEVAGLRETIEGSDDDREDTGRNQPPSYGASSGKILFGDSLSNGTVVEQPIPELPDRVRRNLLEIYHQRVDSVYKMFHWPTTLATIEKLNMVGETNATLSSASIKALEPAICLMALCSVSDAECLSMGLGDRASMIQRYRIATETAISKTQLLSSPDITSLQAFVIYLIALRICESCALSWTLLAIAARAASALRLGFEDPMRYSVFDLEIRRRLWFFIGLVDTHVSHDRGSAPLVPATGFEILPLNVNDADLAPDTLTLNPSQGLTEMSFFLMTCESLVCYHKLCAVDNGDDSWRGWGHKLRLVESLEQSFQTRFSAISQQDEPIYRFMKAAAYEIIAALQLSLRRPLCPQHRISVPLWDSFDVLQAATEVLKRSLVIKDNEFALWAWKSWVQWHALAVALAELCSSPGHPAADATWPVVCEGFRRYAHVIADSQSGMLWKPIAKLMRRAQILRQERDGSRALMSVSDTPSARLGENELPEQLLLPNTDEPGQERFSGRRNGNHLLVESGWTTGYDLGTELGEDLGMQDGTATFNWDIFLDDMNYSDGISGIPLF